MKYFKTLIVMLISSSTWGLIAQEYTTAKPSGKLILHEINELEIIGGDYNEIKIVTNQHKSSEEDERTKGMRILSPSGMQDNTMIGLYMEESGSDVIFTQISPNFDFKYKIYVPKSTSVSYEHTSHHGDDLLIGGVTGEVEVSVHHNDVVLRNMAGPCAINSLHGSIDAQFIALPTTGAVYLHARHDDVDVTLPASANANLKLYSNHGTIYTDLDLNVEKQDAHRQHSRIHGTLNGGGTEIHIESTHDNVYLRKS